MAVMTHDARVRDVAGTSVRAMADRIVRTYEQASAADIAAGAGWYADGERFVDDLAMQAGCSRETAAAVVAHLSPRTTWKRNKESAAALLLTGDAPVALRANVDRARVAMASPDPLATLNGPKTSRFARNLLGDRSVVTVDMWAVRVAMGGREDAEYLLTRAGVYDAVEHAYRCAADRLGVDAVAVQATTWVVVRGRAD